MSLIDKIAALGDIAEDFVYGVGNSLLFLARIIRNIKVIWVQGADFIKAWYNLGFLSLAITIISALFIGMVMGLQSYYALSKFGASSQIGGLVAASIVRELGPVVTSLLFAGRACSSLASELGLMRSTEQLDAMEMMGVDSIRNTVVPRFFGVVVSLPLLVLIFDAVAIIGGYIIGVLWLGLDSGIYWGNTQKVISLKADILMGVYKSLVFAVLLGWIASYQGFFSMPGAAGVSRAATRSVVYGSILVLLSDFIITALLLN